MCVCMYNLVACKVCYHVLVVIFPMPHDRGCEIKIIVTKHKWSAWYQYNVAGWVSMWAYDM